MLYCLKINFNLSNVENSEARFVFILDIFVCQERLDTIIMKKGHKFDKQRFRSNKILVKDKLFSKPELELIIFKHCN